MDIIVLIFMVLLALCVLATVLFFLGPAVIEAVVKKAEQWHEILQAIKGQK